jgi:hypothetical protein
MKLRKISIAFGILLVAAFLSGCQQPEQKTEATPATQAIKQGAPGGKPAGGGGVPDMSDYPAPPGVKTGIEGGKK